jgi:hypothetical protein
VYVHSFFSEPATIRWLDTCDLEETSYILERKEYISSEQFNHTLKENQFLEEAFDSCWCIVGTAHLTSRLATPARLAAGG